MKKSILFATMLAVMGTAQAQKLTYIPWTENALLEGVCVSPNGEYIGGTDLEGRAFIYSTQTGEIKFYVHPDLEAGDQSKDSRVNSINDNGVGVGYYGDNASRFDFAAGTHTESFGDMSYSTFISNDGTFECGFTWDNAYVRTPYVMVNGEKQLLPEATDAWMGYTTDGFSPRSASDDGSVIMGLAVDNFATYPLVLWVRNKDNATYSLIPVSKRFFDPDYYDCTGPQEYGSFSGQSISPNGRWIVVDAKVKGFGGESKIVRYDVANDVVENISCPDASALNWYLSTGVSNDGTIVGYVENKRANTRTAFIVKGGETDAQYMADVYQDLDEIVQMNNYGLNTPMAISPDSRYIVGFGYVSLNADNLGLATYYIDTQAEPDAVKDVAKKDNAAAQKQVVGTYTMDGKQVNVSTTGNRKGLFIDKMADGRFVKQVR